MWKRHEPGIELKSPEQFAVMREAGLVVAAALRAAAAAAAPGVSTADLDAVASEVIRAAGAVPSFKGYHGYPATLCTSVNEEIVHGIPGPGRRLRRRRPAVHRLRRDRGRLARRRRAQPRDRRAAPEPGPAAGRLRAGDVGRAGPGPPGARLTDISHAVEATVRAAGRGYGIVEDYVGHFIGSEMHMEPPVLNQGRPGRGPLLTAGMALAVEPLLTAGSPETVLDDDGWTVRSADGRAGGALRAHGRDHRRRPLGADRTGRRRGRAGPGRRPGGRRAAGPPVTTAPRPAVRP